ncbi:MAG: F0F1 ATP synthase subunit A [Deltaproteobacteria bacterium]|nr:F0F1 ATP synthase subunit A [Deltaproteobacteria bacterium]
MELSPDSTIFWQWGPVKLTATIVYTWVVMALLSIGSWLVTRRLSSDGKLSRRQNLLETLVTFMNEQIRSTSRQEPGRFLPFVGTLFLFIAVSNSLEIIPGFHPPTGSLSTTAALAICVFIAVPFYGVLQKGVVGYLMRYVKPSIFMMPFEVIGEFSRTLALAVRLYGNIMSGTIIVGILLSIAPLFFPIVMQALGLLIGLIQAYIFAVLAMVYIASATSVRIKADEEHEKAGKGGT